MSAIQVPSIEEIRQKDKEMAHFLAGRCQMQAHGVHDRLCQEDYEWAARLSQELIQNAQGLLNLTTSLSKEAS